MNSWWDLGEFSGFDGDELKTCRIQCPFCYEKGSFSIEHHAEKKKPNSRKVLNFDTLKCGNCAGYVMSLWSRSRLSGSRGIYDYRILPFPLRVDEAPEYWPDEIRRYWIQTQRSLQAENWDAAAVMARSAMQVALRSHNASGDNLKSEIISLANSGRLPPLMKEWSDNIRELGNDSAHPKPGQPPTAPEDAKDIVEFLDFLLEYLYTLPKRIQDYRSRRNSEN